jgi:hypothetical protein
MILASLGRGNWGMKKIRRRLSPVARGRALVDGVRTIPLDTELNFRSVEKVAKGKPGLAATIVGVKRFAKLRANTSDHERLPTRLGALVCVGIGSGTGRGL